MNEKQFIGQFLMWYDDSPSLPDVANQLRLSELAKKAREIQLKNIKNYVKTLKKEEEIVEFAKKVLARYK